jgi:hypothetical protein
MAEFRERSPSTNTSLRRASKSRHSNAPRISPRASRPWRIRQGSGAVPETLLCLRAGEHARCRESVFQFFCRIFAAYLIRRVYPFTHCPGSPPHAFPAPALHRRAPACRAQRAGSALLTAARRAPVARGHPRKHPQPERPCRFRRAAGGGAAAGCGPARGCAVAHARSATPRRALRGFSHVARGGVRSPLCASAAHRDRRQGPRTRRRISRSRSQLRVFLGLGRQSRILDHMDRRRHPGYLRAAAGRTYGAVVRCVAARGRFPFASARRARVQDRRADARQSHEHQSWPLSLCHTGLLDPSLADDRAAIALQREFLDGVHVCAGLRGRLHTRRAVLPETPSCRGRRRGVFPLITITRERLSP